MIQGLKLHFTSAEIVQHLQEREVFHADKAARYDEQIEVLAEGGDHEQPGLSNDPITGLKRSRDEHARKAAYFAVLTKHVIQDETYELAEADLSRIEILDRWF